ncbi:MAG: DegQ family serine endoprotease [Acidobacteriota bacterium]|nr:DegQ family serine endoprotease [Acidobacteriota bacterium]
MRITARGNILVIALLLMNVLLFSGCEWIKPGDVEIADAKKTEAKPPAPVVVDGTRTSYADIVEKASPAVVQITAVFKQSTNAEGGGFENGPLFPGPQMPSRGAGSGVIVSKDGTILTNHHVIDSATRITVEMSDNKTFDAEVVGSDKPSDLAVLKIKGEEFPFLKLGDSDRVRVGDIVLAIGNPLGIGQSVTSGIISAKSRTTPLVDNASFQEFLQTDAPINRGNSGGALVNVNGELIGINSQILSQSGGSIGIGFAVPSNMAANVMEQLLKTGKVRRGMLGINIQTVNAAIAKQFGMDEAAGVIVSDVKSGGAAEKAGVKRGDIITALNGEKVDDGNALRNKVAGTLPGTEIKLSILRDKKQTEIAVTLDEYDLGAETGAKAPNTNDESGDSRQDRKLGVSVQPISPELASRFRIPDEVRGLVITDVDPKGPAAEAGLRPGFVIVEVNRQIVESIGDMRKALESSGDGAVLLLISRQGQTAFVTVRP